MRTMAVCNYKGGTGKTTTAVNLAACFAAIGRRVLLVDLDPQASATQWCGVRDAGRGIMTLFTDGCDLMDLIRPSSIDGVDLAPSSATLAGLEKAVAGEVGTEVVLRHALARLPANTWDDLLIDCPPSLSLLTINALSAVQEVLIPVEAHMLALNGLPNLLHVIDIVRERLGGDLRRTRIVACRVNARTRHAREVLADLRERYRELVCATVVRENVRVAECPSVEQSIVAYDPRSNGAADYQALAEELLQPAPGLPSSARRGPQ